MGTDDEVVDVVHRASELYEAERAAPTVDPREVAEELGIPAEYVAKAEAERASRRLRSRRAKAALLVAAAIAACSAGALLLASRTGARTSTAPTATALAATAPAATAPLSRVRVAVDVRHCEEPRDGALTLARAKATPTLVGDPYSEAMLASFDVIVLSNCRKDSLTSPEVEALRSFVAGGGGLVVADLGWSWVHYVKRPIEELPANRLGKAVGFSLGVSVLGAPAPPDPATELAGSPVTTRSGWVAGDVSFTAPAARIWLHDSEGRAMAGAAPRGQGRIAVFGHHGILDDNPFVLVRAVESVRPEAAQRPAPASTDRPTLR
ncbi:MAG: hypothetical protein JST00_03755 [Deltaproteobacteria bacterium]|nr:hypothetical protein [Deltaproteobacteria bacterium]